MTDLVKRLRISHFLDGREIGMTAQRAEAADEIERLTLKLFAADGANQQHEAEIERLRAEIERLRAALKPFAEVAKGIPDNWPGECHLRIDSALKNGTIRWREWLSYHGIHDCDDAMLPTIGEWRKAKEVCDD